MEKKDAFVKIPIQICEDPTISLAAKAVYLCLRRFAPNIFPTLKTIQGKTGCCKNTAMRALKELEEKEFIVIHKSHRKPNRYFTSRDEYVAFSDKSLGANFGTQEVVLGCKF